MGVSGDLVEDRSYLSLSPASGLLTDACNLWTWDPASLRSVMGQVIEDEAVQCVDDLVLRRTNRATTEADPDRVRE